MIMTFFYIDTAPLWNIIEQSMKSKYDSCGF